MPPRPDDWPRVRELFEAALALPADARRSYVAKACDGDAPLRQQVELLLDSHDRANNFPETPAAPPLGDTKITPYLEGKRIGPYLLGARIGAGGMGEVYKARDTRLDRTVAIKVLPAHVATDPHARERFEREARAVAALNHPHICTLHDVGRHDGVDYLVMEYVDGETLAARVARGPVPLAQAFEYAIQIASALDKAHRAGIVHRDLKPGNVMLTKAGAKLLDFGLAKACAPTVATGVTRAMVASELTTPGTILGTVQYMAPEQLEGKDADARTDIFAFGALVYEMVTGRKAFEGSSQASVIAAILEHEPAPLRQMIPLAPPALDRVISTCLAKDPDDRWQTMRDLLRELKWVATATPEAAGLAPRAGWLWPGAAALATLLLLLLAFVHFREQPSNAAPMRFQVPLPANLRFSSSYGSFAVSPDGRSLAYFATGSDGISRLWLRALDSLEARPLPGTETVAQSPAAGSPRPPFWSPDGRFIAFGFQGKLRKVDITGGIPQVLCDLPDAAVGGSWNGNDVIIVGNNRGGLMRVSAAGGIASALTVVDSSRNERSTSFPVFLPDGEHFLYSRLSNVAGNTGIYVGSLAAAPEAQSVKRLVASDSGAVLVPSPGSNSGNLLFLRQGTLMAQRFDTSRLELAGEPIRVVDRVGSFASFGFFSASNNGVLVYRVTNQNSQMTWFDRQGKVLETLGEQGLYPSSMLSLSRDGTKAAIPRSDDQGTDIWLFELMRGLTTRFTYGPAANTFPVWSPDGQRVTFASNRAGHFDLYQRASNGGGDDELLFKSDKDKFPTSWSSNGFLLYTEGTPPATDVWLLPLDSAAGDRKAIPFARTRFYEDQASFSPSGDWIAYVSAESGASEVYVQPFDPSASGGGQSARSKWIVSKGGGSRPHWRGDGHELFYLAPDGRVMTVAVTSPPFQAGVPQPLFQGPFNMTIQRGTFADTTAPWDVTSDGGRFLFLVQQVDNSRVPFTVLLNWTAGLKK